MLYDHVILYILYHPSILRLLVKLSDDVRRTSTVHPHELCMSRIVYKITWQNHVMCRHIKKVTNNIVNCVKIGVIIIRMSQIGQKN
jgi:hypothetical protein